MGYFYTRIKFLNFVLSSKNITNCYCSIISICGIYLIIEVMGNLYLSASVCHSVMVNPVWTCFNLLSAEIDKNRKTIEAQNRTIDRLRENIRIIKISYFKTPIILHNKSHIAFVR